MFNNVGSKIKGVISVVSGIMMIASIIAGIAAFFVLRWELEGFWAFVIASLIAGVGVLFSWLSNLVGYAYGQLVENSDRIREMLENDGDDRAELLTKLVENSATKTTQSNTTAKSAPVKASASFLNENTNYVTCPSCKESQPAGKSYCNICGAKMSTNVPASTPAAPLKSVGNATKSAGSEKKGELVVCPKCGELQPRGLNYCQVCGGKIPYTLN